MTFPWIPALAGWFLLMTWLSHQSGPKTARQSRALARGLQPLVPGRDLEQANRILRKAAHLVVFGVLTLLALGACRTAPAAVPTGVVYGLLAGWCWLDEATKIGIPGRHFSWLDVGLNGAGVALGAIAWTLLFI